MDGRAIASLTNLPAMCRGYNQNRVLINAFMAVSYTHLTLPTSDLV